MRLKASTVLEVCGLWCCMPENQVIMNKHYTTVMMPTSHAIGFIPNGKNHVSLLVLLVMKLGGFSMFSDAKQSEMQTQLDNNMMLQKIIWLMNTTIWESPYQKLF